MSHTNRNFVIAYILLVGLPLAALAGILKSGRHLVAPISIDGTWKVDVGSIPAPGQACEKAITSLTAPSFVISQSGQTLALKLNNDGKSAGEGSLDGKSMKASFGTTDGSVAGCSADQPLVMTASVDPGTEPRSLAGVISVDGCTSCATVQFHAVRQPKAQSGGGH